MIISRTPYRVSFLGGGTDYPGWYEEHGGCVLATSINRYCYITCRNLPPFFKHKHRIVYSKIEMTQTLDEIVHPAVRECMRFMKITDGIEIHHDGDLPKQTGLGTSSSFAVGMLNVLHALRGEMATSMQLAKEAIHVERDLCKENVGSQDQVTPACGGLNCIDFSANDTIRVRPLPLVAERNKLFQDHLMLFFTGFSRIASSIAKEQIENIPSKGSELTTMQQMVEEGVSILSGRGDILAFGELLNEGWKLKRTLSRKITNEQIDDLYAKAMSSGATGGKLCGAGGGGFLLLFVPPEKQPAVMTAMDSCLHVPFEFETDGSRIILFQPE